MPRIRSTKSLAKRIDLQYFTRRSGFRRWLLWLSLALPVIAVGWLAYATFSHKQNIYNKGPLSAAHSILTTNCGVCHLRPAGYRAGVPDKACHSCHDSPPHNARQTFTPACSSCHVEHVGRIRLAEISDSGCTQCHSDLKTNDRQPTIVGSVGGFDKKHPEFAVLRSGQPDTGTINFNHYVHLQPTSRDLRGPVQMVCSDCHRPTNTPDPWPYSVAAVQPASQQPVSAGVADTQQRKRRSVKAGAGAYMSAIRYVNQCAACHVLQFDRLIPQPAPHDKPEIVHAFIVSKYSDYIRAHPEALRTPMLAIDDGMPARLTLSVLRPTGSDQNILARSPEDWVQQRAAAAERLLWNKNCKICHISTVHAGFGLPQSVKAIIPARWLPRAEFDHEAHLMLTCTACHANIANSHKTSDINLPGIALCRECHKEAGPTHQAAEGRCFECHSYHDWRKEKQVNGIMELSRP